MLQGMFDAANIAEIERAIHMAIAPAFLLTGIFAALNVLTQRIGRMLDRERDIQDGLSPARPGERRRLALRARHAQRALYCCLVAALLLCGVIVLSFVGVVFELLAAFVVAGLLLAAMLALVGALLLFLNEVRLGAADLPAPHDR